jgi:formylglycine-generating enzyme required for sulfatase activity
MRVRQFAGIAMLCLAAVSVWGANVAVTNVTLGNLTATTVDITYTLTRATPAISVSQPIWIFVKYTGDAGSTWMDTDNSDRSDDWGMGGMTGVSTVNSHLSGNVGIVTSGGARTITWTWGVGGTNLTATDQVRVRVYAVEMCQVTADAAFAMGADGGANAITSGTANLASDFYLQKYPITNRMYVDFLNEVGNVHDNTADGNHDYWNATQNDATRGGISMSGGVPTAVWSVIAGREDWPVIGVNWLNAYDMTRWMGLVPPSEERWEKGCRSVGGAAGNIYSWGSAPVASTSYCDMSGSFSPGRPCDVNTYEQVWTDNSMSNPFGFFEMTGNVWEWTDTQSYMGAYDASKSGLTYATPPANVITRGGSWGVIGTNLYGSARAINSAYTARNTFTGIRAAKP